MIINSIQSVLKQSIVVFLAFLMMPVEQLAESKWSVSSRDVTGLSRSCCFWRLAILIANPWKEFLI